MQKILLSLLGLLFVFSSFSQPWMNLIPSEKKNQGFVNFYDIQSAFNQYWKNKKVVRSHGWKQFKRWENFMEPRVYPTGTIPKDIYWNEVQKIGNEKNLVANWTSMGPGKTPTDINTTDFKRGSGRINCIAFHPTNSDILFAGAPAGGFWKSTTGGNSWITTTDQLASIGISDIAVNLSNPDIIYIVTGDADGSDTYSAGIMKSLDGGSTWNIAGNAHSVLDFVLYKKIIIHPTDVNILYAASNQGIYKTINAGTTWSIVIQGDFKDICFKPGNPNIIYASEYNQVYKSVNGGNSFNPVSVGFNSGEASRIALAVTIANPNVVYALCAGGDGGFLAVYKSMDSGINWSETVNSGYGNLLGWSADGTDQGGQGWYDLALAVSPINENIVYVGGVNIWKSIDGGANWNINAHWFGDGGTAYVHADQHCFAFNPLTGDLFSGNDGGLHKSINGTDWIDVSDFLQILQIYRLGVSDSNPNIVVIGAQDNGSMKYDNGNWWGTIGGDGMEALVDYADENIMYAEYYYGAINKSIDGGHNFIGIKPPSSPNGAWVTPYIIHPTDHNTLFMGFDDVYKTTNAGADWTTISSGLTGGSDLKILTVAPSNTQYIYVATGNDIYRTSNGGTSWSTITNNISGNYFTYISVSSSDPLKIWVTVSGYSDGQKVFSSINGGNSWTNYSTGLPNLPVNCIVFENNTNDALYVGTDVGAYYRNASMSQWISFSSGLPNVVVSELEIQYKTRKLRAATFGRGLWESDLYEALAIPHAQYSHQIISNCEGIANFYNASTGVPTSNIWIFGDGDSSFVKNPTHTYSHSGTYHVKLIVSNSMGNDTIESDIVFLPLSVNAGFQTDNATACSAPSTVQFKNTSENSFTYFWDFGDGATSTEANPVHIYQTAGNFDVKLVVQGGFCGSDSIEYTGIVNINNQNSGNQSMPLYSTNSVQTCCTGKLFDSGGTEYYQNNTHSIVTISPANTAQVSLDFISFDFELGANNSCDYDYLSIYDGNDIHATLIGKYCNNNIPPSVLMSTTGSITIEQYSDPGVTGTGFELNWSCVVSDKSTKKTDLISIQILPNPSDGLFKIKCTGLSELSGINIYDVTGTKIYENSYSNLEAEPINIKNFGKGIYVAQVFSGNNVFHKKIVLE